MCVLTGKYLNTLLNVFNYTILNCHRMYPRSVFKYEKMSDIAKPQITTY